MDVFDRAIIFATEAHSGSFRKGTTTPYIVHPMEAAAIAATITDDKNVLAAAVLHDVVEDTEKTINDIRAEFGDDVARLVAGESEDKREDLPAESTWEVRKQETINRLEKVSREEKIITLSDKLSNIRAMYRDYSAIGDALWDRFNQKDKSKHGWYYRSIAERLTELSDSPAYKEYVDLVEKVFG